MVTQTRPSHRSLVHSSAAVLMEGAPAAAGIAGVPGVARPARVFDARVEFPLAPSARVLIGYAYDRYRVVDRHQEAATPWVEPVGSEFVLRDTSRSHQWGNRLLTLGSYLAPAYRAHVAYAAVTYRF
jgi:hypothetical protein